METITRSELLDLLTAAAVRAVEIVGAKPTISYTKACAQYGNWFKMKADAGLITPAHVGAGKSGKKSYFVSDITAELFRDKQAARIQAELNK